MLTDAKAPAFMTQTNNFTLYLAAGRAGPPNWFPPIAAFAYVLVGLDGRVLHGSDTDPAELLVSAQGDPHYVALLDCMPHVIAGSNVRVVTDQEYLAGKTTPPNPYPGVLNEAPASRAASRYRRGKKREPYKNEDQLRALDAVLIEREIVLSAALPTTLGEMEEHRRRRLRVADILAFDPDRADY